MFNYNETDLARAMAKLQTQSIVLSSIDKVVKKRTVQRKLKQGLPGTAMFLPHPKIAENRRQSIPLIIVRGVPFRKVKPIGEGYQSNVFEARKLTTGLRCAVKIVTFKHSDMREQKNLYNTFLKELSLMAKLNGQSASIARVFEYDIDKINMVGKIVMELGLKDFRSILPLRLSPEEKIVHEPRRKLFWRQMVEAVRVLHSNRITHSDVKPENFIFVKSTLKIIDFGMSFVVPIGQNTCVRPFAGTPDYMPPEVCRHKGVLSRFGYKADIWSLGCILYEMSFGERPFERIYGDKEKMRFIGSIHSMIIPPTTDYLLQHILEWCLQPIEALRPSAEQLMNHPYIKLQ